jgi:predicted nucleotidyltransferase
LEVFGVKCRFVNLEKLIVLKRAAGRPKDFEVLAELEALLEERSQQSKSP